MSTDNPYAFHPGSSFDNPIQGSQDVGLNRSLQALIDTRPWVRIIGILTAIGAVVMVIAGCGVLATVGGRGAGPIEIMFQVLFLGIAVPYGFAAKFLLAYGAAITRAEGTRSLNDIADALVQQKSFWKLIGITTVITVFFYLVFILLMIAGHLAF